MERSNFIRGEIWCTDGPDPLVEPVESWLDKVITEAVCEYMNNGFFNMSGDKIGFQCADPIDHDCTTDLSTVITEWGIDMHKNISGKIEGKEGIANAKKLREILLNVVKEIDLALET